MKYFAAFLPMLDAGKSQTLRTRHLEHLEQHRAAGHIFAKGRFADGTGGLVIYQADSLEAARQFAESDPYVVSGARGLEFHEWEMK